MYTEQNSLFRRLKATWITQDGSNLLLCFIILCLSDKSNNMRRAVKPTELQGLALGFNSFLLGFTRCHSVNQFIQICPQRQR